MPVIPFYQFLSLYTENPYGFQVLQNTAATVLLQPE